MAETQETIADIIAEKRRQADKIERNCAEMMKRGKKISDCYVRELVADIRREADRLEEAHKREAVTDCNQLREALNRLDDLLYIGADGEVHGALGKASEIERTVKAALAAHATAEKPSAVGDVAKLREALKLCLRCMCGYCRMDAEARGMTKECVNGCEALLMAKAALAAPPRNCDKVKTSWDVLKKWHEWLDTANDIVRMLDWLLAPATEKEGGAK